MNSKIYSILTLMGNMFIGLNNTNPYAIRGKMDIDTSDKSRKERYARYLKNMHKPWKGMKYFNKYGVWAINEKNAIRKSSIA